VWSPLRGADRANPKKTKQRRLPLPHRELGALGGWDFGDVDSPAHNGKRRHQYSSIQRRVTTRAARHRRNPDPLFPCRPRRRRQLALACSSVSGRHPEARAIQLQQFELADHKTAWGLSWPASKLLQVSHAIEQRARRSHQVWRLRAFRPSSGNKAAAGGASASQGRWSITKRPNQQGNPEQAVTHGANASSTAEPIVSPRRLDQTGAPGSQVIHAAGLPQHRHHLLLAGEARQRVDFVSARGFSASFVKKFDPGQPPAATAWQARIRQSFASFA